MLIEDDVLLAMEMEDFLADLGFEVVGPYGKLADALQAVDEESVDGAVVDLNLRGELSFPLIEKLRAEHIPLIVCSGYVDLPGMNERLSDLPRVSKPCDTNALVAMMRDLFLDERREHAQAEANDSSHTRPVSG